MVREVLVEPRAVAMARALAGKALSQTRNGLTLVLAAPPTFDSNTKGEKTTVVCRVSLFDKSGKQIDIDPDRRFVNPPGMHKGERNPEHAFWEILWDSVVSVPNASRK